MTIHIHADFKPNEDAFEAVKSTLSQSVERVRAEPGCLRYDLFQSGKSLVMVEEWADRDLLDAHARSEGFTSLMADLDGKLREKVEVRLLREVTAD